MEIVNIDKQTFEELLEHFSNLIKCIDTICNKFKNKKLGEWLDAQDVCLILNITPRTLQAYRETGKIGFSQIEKKIFYKSCDVNALLENNYINKLKLENYASCNKKG